MQYAPAILLSALAMTLIVGGRYLLSSGFFAWLTNRVRPGQYDRLKPQIGREIRWSLLSAAIYGIPAGIVAWGWQNAGWTRIYTDPHMYPLWYLPLSLFLYLMLRCRYSGSRSRDTDSCRRFGFGIAGDDGYGRLQPYGLGDVPALACSGKVRAMAHNRHPSRKASRSVQR